eukprot:293327-Rhodomonas_salina.1
MGFKINVKLDGVHFNSIAAQFQTILFENCQMVQKMSSTPYWVRGQGTTIGTFTQRFGIVVKSHYRPGASYRGSRAGHSDYNECINTKARKLKNKFYKNWTLQFGGKKP